MAWMAVPLKSIFFYFFFIFRFSDFSVAFVFRRGGSLRWISKISNQLIYSLSSGLFFLQSNIAYVVLVDAVDNIFIYLGMYVGLC